MLSLLAATAGYAGVIPAEDLAAWQGEGGVLFAGGAVKGDAAGVAIEAGVEGLREISLVTKVAEGNPTGLYADWLDARFAGGDGAQLASDAPWPFAWTFLGDQWRCADAALHRVRADRTARDTGLQHQGKPAEKGFGVHGSSLVVLKVPPGAKKFTATAALDDATTSQGAVQFIVLAGSPTKESSKRLDIPQVLPEDVLALVKQIKTIAGAVAAREYQGLWQELLFDRVLMDGCVSDEEYRQQACHPGATILPEDRDPADIVLRRTKALLADLTASGAKLKEETATLGAFELLVKDTPVADSSTRTLLYSMLCASRRKIAFANPLLKDIQKLAFITREAFPPEELNYGVHMVDQFFGFHATLKGSVTNAGLYVLENPFSENPSVKNLLAGHVVEDGARKGQALAGGGFLGLDVAYDGSQILFAYTDGAWQGREWNERSVFHIFRCNADGSGLVQITDGAKNDLHPCWLPNGRVAFTSERRLGFGRCHPRPSPSYTLHSMFPDGTDIVRLSAHETNEWQPSVDNNGMLLYTRWDYVDRGFSQAHHLWVTTPDGRDAREVNGNSHTSLRTAPMFIGDGRGIPGSGKYMATACGHHTEVRGTLIIVDPSVPDDNAMSQIRRFTPDQALPEAEVPLSHDKASGAYATPFPLSEKYALCVCDPLANAQYGYMDWRDRRYAIALVDVFGNREVIETGLGVSALSPMPLQARKKPPVLPHQTLVGRPALDDGTKPERIPDGQLPKTARVGVVNVYNSRYPFAEGTRIKALRIWQMLPKVSPIVNKPRIGLGDQKGGRQCLGTVPVEEDGSAFFEMPVNVPVLFHAIDEKGVAVQGMRSVTYTAPGETLMCNGCHEQRVGLGVQRSSATPAAMKRAPSAITPEAPGTNPWSYPRLVQPVLDAKCAGCHGEKRKDNMPDLRRGNYLADADFFYTSIRSLAKHVHHYGAFIEWDEFTPPSTFPGQFGAYASPLYAMLTKGHHDVQLTAGELHRLVLFMESNATFIGHDHDARAQAEGWVIYPVIE